MWGFKDIMRNSATTEIARVGRRYAVLSFKVFCLYIFESFFFTFRLFVVEYCINTVIWLQYNNFRVSKHKKTLCYHRDSARRRSLRPSRLFKDFGLYTVLRHSSASVEVICLARDFCSLWCVAACAKIRHVSQWTRCVEGVSTKLGLGRGLPRKLFDLIWC